MKRTNKICACVIAILTTTCLALMLICNQIVVNNAEGKAYSDIDSIGHNKVGLLVTQVPVPMTHYNSTTC